ncbi:putative Pentatricopeptide repeat-containing protein [Quillaja saponaria]|uniref:Pentatricopeptide repeat-containing protein n=1 Tax=Quillaja saponaria TaxID=32244 RepID=A0AAD7QFH8_QUISA|nr:putative Pentatricopeptide repeat-containing protein [Quillaja saponaria]
MRALHLLFKPTSVPAKATTVTSFPKKSTTQPHGASHHALETRFISLIHASKTSKQIQEIHAQVIEHNLFLRSRIVTQFISSCSLQKSMGYALSIFHQFEVKNLFVFNALIRGLCENAQFESSVSYFVLMMRLNVKPDRLTLPFGLKSAAALLEDDLGRGLHGIILKFGLEFDLFVRVSLVDMYVKIEDIGSALRVFDETPECIKLESVLLWNIVINGCCKNGDLTKATELFEAMPQRNIGSWNTLINGFVRKGDMNSANELFGQMSERNVVSWTTMVSGFSQNGEHREALSIFFKMLEENVRPNNFTLVSALSACAKIGALNGGIRIHNFLSNNGFSLTGAIGTSLVDMYAKCGNVEAASQVFNQMKEKEIMTWSVMIWGWAIHGHPEKALQCFEQMKYKAGDHAHKHVKEIYLKLEEITAGARKQGYLPETAWVLHNIEEEEKEESLGSHSEKLALAFGLINTAPGVTIRIVKNLRVCGDCHSIMKYASKMSQSDIVLRDIKRFHHFRDGTCSCGDYW